MAKKINHEVALKDMDNLARLMDNQFRIPGTQIRFGFDAIMGLIPGVGDISSMAVSGYMLTILIRKGASGFLLARMVLNILIDTSIGAIPLVGDLFDVAYKANTKNMQLMRAHYTQGKYQGSAWKLIIPVLVVLFSFLALIGWLVYKFVAWVF